MTLSTQPPPTPSTGDTWRDLIADLGPEYPALIPLMEERRQLGIDKYGVPLQRDNGRDMDIDLMQELADGAVYAYCGGRRETARLLLRVWEAVREGRAR